MAREERGAEWQRRQQQRGIEPTRDAPQQDDYSETKSDENTGSYLEDAYADEGDDVQGADREKLRYEDHSHHEGSPSTQFEHRRLSEVEQRVDAVEQKGEDPGAEREANGMREQEQDDSDGPFSENDDDEDKDEDQHDGQAEDEVGRGDGYGGITPSDGSHGR
ncbi:hypothetical protein BAUCODRAFT_23084 [Baudoinia panamericana UAMH 10762]|uniref:Uncharacterized protein n=1 Tax=Baudoinia panamericana (strain UAMH 10762) TaxID=717646 RepID=M2N2V2_BAUPA|nr:uncharacterized protein BAUCODRAFT_23084 [Baudoinia panamericana UAMH 10762]EMC98283.1 hypothetical protein BAUCODRAFT_23084 [Baudoinia panamericana UAMH 10762]